MLLLESEGMEIDNEDAWIEGRKIERGRGRGEEGRKEIREEGRGDYKSEGWEGEGGREEYIR